VHDLAPGSFLNVFKVVRAVFKKFGAGPVFWGGLTTPRRSDPEGRSNRPRHAM
jgi:hypothetical protein